MLLFNQMSLYLFGRGLFKFGIAKLYLLYLLVRGQTAIKLLDGVVKGLLEIFLTDVLGEFGHIGEDYSNEIYRRAALTSDYHGFCNGFDV